MFQHQFLLTHLIIDGPDKFIVLTDNKEAHVGLWKGVWLYKHFRCIAYCKILNYGYFILDLGIRGRRNKLAQLFLW